MGYKRRQENNESPKFTSSEAKRFRHTKEDRCEEEKQKKVKRAELIDCEEPSKSAFLGDKGSLRSVFKNWPAGTINVTFNNRK